MFFLQLQALLSSNFFLVLEGIVSPGFTNYLMTSTIFLTSFDGLSLFYLIFFNILKLNF